MARWAAPAGAGNNAVLAVIDGPSTRDAVMSWQRRARIGVDGIVGPQTRASLSL